MKVFYAAFIEHAETKLKTKLKMNHLLCKQTDEIGNLSQFDVNRMYTYSVCPANVRS